jgi:hypothetical protein
MHLEASLAQNQKLHYAQNQHNAQRDALITLAFIFVIFHSAPPKVIANDANYKIMAQVEIERSLPSLRFNILLVHTQFFTRLNNECTPAVGMQKFMLARRQQKKIPTLTE